MISEVIASKVDRAALRDQIEAKYCDVAKKPEQGFHFHTGRPLAAMLEYPTAEVDALPESTIESFAGTGNPFLFGKLHEGETVLDIGCGAGFDTLQAAQQIGPSGRVIAVDMTDAMLEKTRLGAEALGLTNVDAKLGYAEELPADNESVDVVISNGVINLTPDKMAVMQEVYRVLKPGGRFQIADIIIQKPVDQDAKYYIDLWSG